MFFAENFSSIDLPKKKVFKFIFGLVFIFDYFTKYIKIQLKIILGMKMRKNLTLYT